MFRTVARVATVTMALTFSAPATAQFMSPNPNTDVTRETPTSVTRGTAISEIPEFEPGQLTTSDDLNRLVAALKELDRRLARIEKRLRSERPQQE